MKMVLHIGGFELRSLFFSPIAWVLLAVFSVQVSIAYVSVLHVAAANDFSGVGGQGSIASAVFGNPVFSISARLSEYLFLYVPLITMGLFSREVSTGSVKLLYSSPVSLLQLVLGKYAAVLGYFALYVLFIAALALFQSLLTPSFDFPVAAAGIFGLYLLMACYGAIGLFVSSLTANQVVAAVSTLGILTVLHFVGELGQRVPFLGDFLHWFALPLRLVYTNSGLVASKDIAFFLIVIVALLSLTCLKLRDGRRVEPWFVGHAWAGMIVMAVVLASALTSWHRLSFYYDATRTNINTLPEGVRSTMTGLEGPWRMTAYVNVLGEYAYGYLPERRRASRRITFSEYARENPEFTLTFVLYAASPGSANLSAAEIEAQARKFAKSHRLDFDDFLTLDEAQAQAGAALNTEMPTYVLSWRDRQETVRTFRDQRHSPSDGEMGAAFTRLFEGPRTIAYAIGHGERRALTAGIDDHRRAMASTSSRSALVNQGFEIIEIDPGDGVGDEVDILVLAAPTRAYDPAALAAIQGYIGLGGDLLIMAEVQSRDALEPLLSSIGVEVAEESLLQPKEGYPASIVFSDFNQASSEIDFKQPENTAGYYVVTPDAVSLSVGDVDVHGFDAVPLLTARKRWTLLDEGHASSSVTALALERLHGSGSQRIVVVGDADFLTSGVAASREYPQRINAPFSRLMMHWLTDNAVPVDTTRPPATDNRVGIQIHQVDYVRIALFGVFPLILTALGSGLLLSRQRQ